MADDTTATPEDTGGTVWDDPNRQSVGLDPGWVEGTGGGSGGDTVPPDGGETPPVSLDAMTKAQLLEYAQSIGVSPANNDMTKDELRAGIDAKQGA